MQHIYSIHLTMAKKLQNTRLFLRSLTLTVSVGLESLPSKAVLSSSA